VSEPHPPSDRGDHENHRTLLSQAWEIARYAPIGLLVEGPFLLPKLAEMGKAHVRNARTVGRLAVRQGEAELRRRLAGTDNQIVDVLRLLGLLPPDEEPSEAPHSEAGPPAAPQAPTAEGRDDVEGRDDQDAGRPVVADAGLPSEDLAADDLAIPNYDSLSASQVVQRLSGLRPDELEAVRRYEVAHRGRKTILNKVAQLQT
jgi:hypothetical protein